jgi:serine protease Do
MQVVQPYLTENWDSLLQNARKWTKNEPNTAEALYYLAMAEYATNDTQKSEAHLQKVVTMNSQHSQAIYYLGMLAEKNGKHSLALTKVAELDNFDEASARQLKLVLALNEYRPPVLVEV